jgi:hypothetical protein
VSVEADAFVPVITFDPSQVPGAQVALLVLTSSGKRLVHAMNGVPGDWSASGFTVLVRHTDGRSASLPLGCAVVTSDPPNDWRYGSGNLDALFSDRTSTHPNDGHSAVFDFPRVPHTVTVSAGDAVHTLEVPPVPPGTDSYAVVSFVGEDPTPPGCR